MKTKELSLEEAIAHLDDIIENKEWECEDCKKDHIALRKWLKELQRYREDERCGRLVSCVPCKAGDPIYIVLFDRIKSDHIHRIYFDDNNICMIEFMNYWIDYPLSDLGTNLFLHLEEAEQELERRNIDG